MFWKSLRHTFKLLSLTFEAHPPPSRRDRDDHVSALTQISTFHVRNDAKTRHSRCFDTNSIVRLKTARETHPMKRSIPLMFPRTTPTHTLCEDEWPSDTRKKCATRIGPLTRSASSHNKNDDDHRQGTVGTHVGVVSHAFIQPHTSRHNTSSSHDGRYIDLDPETI